MEKIKDRRYAQNVYAALCNMRWQPEEVWPVLTDEYWSCTWRSAGGIVAELRVDSAEDYMDWYCSGIQDFSSDEADPRFVGSGHVPEGTVTDEIRADFATLGWHPSAWPKDKD
jgi:hypothetical protein